MAEQSPYHIAKYDRTDPNSIFDYSRFLIGQSLHSLFGDGVIDHTRKGKGGLPQMVEELFFKYPINNNPDPDFKEAGLELKCTPLLKSKSEDSYRIKERLVCTMIDYFELINTEFEDSHLLSKCRLMLLLFYLHISGKAIYDFEFIFRILWKLPEKDLLLIKKDYEAIAEKVRRGEAHLLSEGDTLYLGACRKGQKGEALQAQPNSPEKAKRRAFSLKPTYMRYILNHVVESGNNFYSNYSSAEPVDFELTDIKQLRTKSFEEIIIERFQPYIGKNYLEICDALGIKPYQAKSKYADVTGLIASNGVSKRISKAEEFLKSGIVSKTVRLRPNGMPKEAMSFKNIDYTEVFENDEWIESEAYEIFTNRFMFVIFKPVPGKTIRIQNNTTKENITEQSFVLDRVFFWTMPSKDLEIAQEYWENIRQNVITNNINLDSFWKLSDHRNFHVRPKAKKHENKSVNPNGGECDKYCYWFNAEYVKQIIDANASYV